MRIIKLEGVDAINEALNAAMVATVNHLVKNGQLSEVFAKEYMETHLCLLVDQHGPFTTLINRLFKKDDSTITKIVIAKVG